jgi:DNA polymerase (family X)
MINFKIATIFGNLAELSKRKDGNVGLVIDYTRAARSIRDYPTDIQEAYNSGLLKNIPGLTGQTCEIIKEYFDTGTIRIYEELKSGYTDELIKLIRITGLGRRRVFAIYEILKAKDLHDLNGKIRQDGVFLKILNNKGLEKDLVTETHLKRLVYSLDYYEKTAGLFPKGYADLFIKKISGEFSKIKDLEKFSVTGSYRRKKSFIHDIDFLLLPSFNLKTFDRVRSSLLLDKLAGLYFAGEVKGREITNENMSIRFATTFGLDAECIITSGPRWAFDLFSTTGSRTHIKKIEAISGKKVSYDNYRDSGDHKNQNNHESPNDHENSGDHKNHNYHVNSGDHENSNNVSSEVLNLKNYDSETDYSDHEIYKSLGIEWVPPELREGSGEVGLAKRFSLPKLVKASDIKGDLHVHSFWSDGLIEMDDIKAICNKYKYEYLALSDHSVSNNYGNGLNEKKLMEKVAYLKKMREDLQGFELLFGGEVDITGAGLLDYDNELLAKMDIVLASMHSSYLNDKDVNTERIIGALKNPMVDIIAHPTGVVFGARAPYALDPGRIFETAVKYDKALEINSYFLRLDINEDLAQMYKDSGGRVVINTDSHRPKNLDMMKLGVEVARRAGLEKKDVINTGTISELKDWKKSRKGPCQP